MKSECRSWMSIERYRDFYDVPRLMLTSDDGGEYWIFDCPFDDAQDEYPSTYRVFSVGKNFQGAIDRFNSSGEWNKVSPVAEVEVQTLLFDDTRRGKFTWPGIQAFLGH